VIRVEVPEAELGIGVVLLGSVAGDGDGRRAYVLEAWLRPETITVDEVPRVVRIEPETLFTPA